MRLSRCRPQASSIFGPAAELRGAEASRGSRAGWPEARLVMSRGKLYACSVSGPCAGGRCSRWRSAWSLWDVSYVDGSAPGCLWDAVTLILRARLRGPRSDGFGPSGRGTGFERSAAERQLVAVGIAV